MKIGSLNVNGINAFCTSRWNLAKELFDNHHPDILGLQEVKGDINRVIKSLNNLGNLGYKVFVNNNKHKGGYAGVALLIDENTIGNLSYQVYESEMIDWINRDNLPEDFYEDAFIYYASGRVLTIETENFIVVTVYTINSGGKDILRRAFDEAFGTYISNLKLENKPIYIMGDMNVCHTSLDMWNWENSIDTMPGLKEYEIDNFNTFIHTLDLTDTFRKLHPDERRYSWSAPKVPIWKKGWRLDYILTDNPDSVISSEIYDRLACSDHRYIEAEIQL